MNGETSSRKNHIVTMVAVAALACVLQDVLHEGLGHGVTAWLSGAHKITMSTVALQSDIDTRWIAASGTLVNLAAAVILWLLLYRSQHYRPVTHYFLVLALAGNLFTATGYFLFSGVANFGDWKTVIEGLPPHWLWRVGLIVLGAASYYGSMLLVMTKLRPFQGPNPRSVRWVCWTPYFTSGALAGLAALFSPFGLFYMIASALPSTLGANAGLLSLPGLMRCGQRSEEGLVIARSVPWIVAGFITSLIFIFVLGRGITWQR